MDREKYLETLRSAFESYVPISNDSWSSINSITGFQTLEKHPDIDRRIPQLHIASHLGITPTQLSRIRKKLKIKARNQPM